MELVWRLEVKVVDIAGPIPPRELSRIADEWAGRTFRHKELAAGGWLKLTFVEQMANTGMDVMRAIRWRDKGRLDYAAAAADRALELLWLTIDDPRNRRRLRELCRLYECLADYLYGDNVYSTDPGKLQKYFLAFGYAARRRR